jgi:hypothetical protein
VRGNRKISAMSAHNFDIASMACDMTRHEFGYDAIGNLT